MRKQKERGFTLVEVLFVIVVIGILIGVLLPRISFISDKSREVGVKNDLHMFQSASEMYMRETTGLNPSESGLNNYLDAAAKITGGVSKLKDPWGNPYKVGVKNISPSEALVVIRSAGTDRLSASTTDAFYYTGNGYDKDDKVLGVYYKKGTLSSCSTGLSTNTGTMNISGAGNAVTLRTVNRDVPSSMRAPYQAAYAYEYAIDANLADYNSATVRTYIYSNSPLNLSIVSTGTSGSSYHYLTVGIKEANNLPYVGFNMWYTYYDFNTNLDPTAYYTTPQPFSSGTLNTVSDEYNGYDGFESQIVSITNVSGASASPYTILNCN